MHARFSIHTTKNLEYPGRSMCNVTDLSHAMVKLVIILQCGDAVILHIKHIPQDAMSYLMTDLMSRK